MVLYSLMIVCTMYRYSSRVNVQKVSMNAPINVISAQGKQNLDNFSDDYLDQWVSNLRLCFSCLCLSLIGSLLGGSFAAQSVSSAAHNPSTTIVTVHFLLATFVCISASFNPSSASSLLLTLQILASYRVLFYKYLFVT